MRRYDWWDGTEYDEVLSVEAEAVRLERLNQGAPFLDSHCSYGLDNVIGSVVPGTAKIENGRGTATILLSKAPGVADTVQKIREGVIRNVSVGYWVHKVVKTEGEDSAIARWDVVDWEPLEISAVPIPADAGSQIRSAVEPSEDGPQLRSCLFITRNPASRPTPKATQETRMATRTAKTAPKGTRTAPGARTAQTAAEIEAEKARKAEERKAALRAARGADDAEEDSEEERDEDADDERDGEDGDERDGEESDDQRDGDDEDTDDEDRDGDDEADDEEGERAAPARAAPKSGSRATLTKAEVRAAAEEAVRKDRVRSGKIRELASQFGFPNLGERHATKGTSVRAFKEIVLERLASRQAKRGTTTFAAAATAGVGETYGGESHRGATRSAREFEKGAAEARALLGKK